jgi:hypothetical protein
VINAYALSLLVLNNFWKSKLLESWPTNQRIETKLDEKTTRGKPKGKSNLWVVHIFYVCSIRG